MRLLCPGGSRFVLDFIQLRTFGLDSRQAIKTLIWRGLSCYLQDISEMFLDFRHTKVSKKEFATMRVFSKNNLASFLAIALTFSQFGSVTRAVDFEVDVTSLPDKNSGNENHSVTDKVWYANAFTIQTGVGNRGAFNSIFLALDPKDMANASDLTVEVYSNDSSQNEDIPKESLGLFKYSGTSYPNPENVENSGYLLFGAKQLALPDDKYWVVVSTDQDVSIKWLKKSQIDPEEGKYASILSEVMKKELQNGSWNAEGNGNEMFRFAINNPVPEPSTYVLGAVMAGVLAFVNRYQARQKMAVKPLI